MASRPTYVAMLAAADLITERTGESWLPVGELYRLGSRESTAQQPVTPATALGGMTSTWLGARRGGWLPSVQASALPFRRGYAQRMGRGTRVLIAMLVVLIVVNVVLLFLLFRPDRVLTAQPSDKGPVDRGSPTATSPPAATFSPSASAHPTTSVEPAPVQRLLVATSSKTAWRATAGDCDDPGEIERSTDGGVSWKRIVRTGPAPIVQLGAEPSGNVFAIGGMRQSCKALYMAYANDGTVTTTTDNPIDVWFPTPTDRDEINGPGGTRATPCKGHVIGLAPVNLSRALVVCANGVAMSTRDSGKTWRELGRIPKTRAASAGNGRYWVARADEACDGVTVQSLTEGGGSLTRGRTRCAPGLDVTGGQIAIDVTGGTIWLWSGNKIAISTDDGETWK
jgi:hypothetical protein